MTEASFRSTELDTEFDMINEMLNTIKEMEDTDGQADIQEMRAKISYIRFLAEGLDDALSGEYHHLRRRRFIIKKTP